MDKRTKYTKPEVTFRCIGVRDSLLVGSPGKRIFEQSSIQSAGQEVEVHDDGNDPFKFTWN